MPFLIRRKTLAIASAVMLTALTSSWAQAQAYPSKPIKFVVPFTAGSATDAVGRIVAQAMGDAWGQAITIENKAGANGILGAEAVKAAPADGYTFLVTTSTTQAANVSLYKKLPYDPVKDFTPIGKIGETILILLAYPKFEAQTLQEIIALSKQPGKVINFGSSGVASPQHIAVELLNQQTGSKLVHVPYKGGGQAMIDVQAGVIPLVFTAVAGGYTYVKSGRLNAVAVSSEKRAASLPDVPTFIESGIKDFVASGWVGIFAPSKVPRPVIEYLNKELNAVLSTPEVIARLDTLGIEASPGTPEKFSKEIAADFKRYGEVIKAADIKAE